MINYFANKFVDDDRKPVLSFDFIDYHANIFAPSGSFYLQVALVREQYYFLLYLFRKEILTHLFFMQIIVFQVLISCILGSIIYFGIIRNQKPKQMTSTGGFFLGYGLVIPLAIWIPFAVLNIFDIRSKAFRFCFITMPMTLPLSCLEAMYGFTDPISSRSLLNYVLSVAFVVRPIYKKDQHSKTSGASIWTSARRHVFWWIATCAMFQWLAPLDFIPFPASRPSNEVFVSFEISQLYNTFFQACT
jgi:hypothetical protein